MARLSLLSQHRRSLAVLIVVASCAFTIAIWQYVGRQETERVRTGFVSRAQTQAAVAAEQIRAYEEMVYSLRDAFIASENVTRAEFAELAQNILHRHEGVQALEWVEIVPHERRAALEERMSRELGRPFQIRQRQPDGTLQPAPVTPEYSVIVYAEPLTGNESVLGYDVNTAPSAPHIAQARRERTLKVTRPFRLLQTAPNSTDTGVIFILPYWRNDVPGAPVLGFVQGVFQVRAMLAKSHRLTTNEALDTYYFEVEDGAEPTLLYANFAGREPLTTPGAYVPLPTLDDPENVVQTLTLGDRRWLMVMRLNPAWARQAASHQPLLILAAGFTITLLLAYSLYILIQRTAHIEKQVAERTRELRASEARLQDIVDHSPAAIFVKDPEGRYLLCNQVFADHCKLPRAQILGRRDEELFPAESVHRYRQHDTEVMRALHPMEFEEADVDPASSRVYLTHKFPLLDDQGKPYALCGIATDITERKAAEEHKLALERKLLTSQKLESLGVLAGGIAHDFNNILTAILGNASLAALDLPADHPVRDPLQRIENAARRASDLCAQMLAYAGKAAFTTAPVNLTALVHDTAALLQVSVGKRNRLDLHTTEPLPAIMGDATQLRQIVMNLVINAADAIGELPNGVITVRTFVTELPAGVFAKAVQSPSLPGGRYVGLEVKDNGAGMTPEVMARIFEPFFTTKFSGRGLGLAACLGIVQRHGGALFLDSTPGRGSTFLLYFPATEAAIAPAPPPPSMDAAPLHGTVLVVDDEEGVRLVATQTLEKLGLQPVVAADGETGLRLYRQHGAGIRLVLLDLTMPGLSGEETLRRLHALNPGIKVVLMSGYSASETMQRCASLGVVDFLAKPFDVASLAGKLRRHLR